MSEYNDVVHDGQGDPFDSERRGYSRRQVDEYIAWRNGQIRELESKLSAGLTEIERLRRELAEAREAGGRPPHEEVSERVGQILKLAADEAKAEREKVNAELAAMRDGATAETDKLRADAKEDTDRLRAEAQDRAERMLTAAQEQSERALTAARSEAESLVTAAQQSTEQLVADATKHADNTVTTAMAQAKQQLDEATARATAIHEGAERRLNLLISRHTETVRRLTEIRDVVTSLVAGEAARGSLEDEVSRALAVQAGTNGAERQPGSHDTQHAGTHRAGPRQGAVGAVEGRRAAAGASHDGLTDQSAPRPGAATRQQTTPLDREPAEPLGAERGTRHQERSEGMPLSADDVADESRRASDSLTH